MYASVRCELPSPRARRQRYLTLPSRASCPEQSGALLLVVRQIEPIERLSDQLRARESGTLFECRVGVDDETRLRIGHDEFVEIAFERERDNVPSWRPAMARRICPCATRVRCATRPRISPASTGLRTQSTTPIGACVQSHRRCDTSADAMPMTGTSASRASPFNCAQNATASGSVAEKFHHDDIDLRILLQKRQRLR